MVDCKRIEPDGDFTPPEVGISVCCKVKGTKYTATITDIMDAGEDKVCFHSLICLYVHNQIESSILSLLFSSHARS